tara:strand:- start:5454 stop:5864 length:411 start_codon:yes stop_codon:yes gene_type:complete
MDNYCIGAQLEIETIYYSYLAYKVAEISGDYNRIHFNDDVAKSLGFTEGKIAHGIWLVGKISSLVSQKLPGDGSIIRSMKFTFINPLFDGEKVLIKLEIIKLSAMTKLITIKCTATKEDNAIIVKGVLDVLPTNSP